ncbi:MAG: hypothetical protein L3K16_02690 [Thermoplasmata archaeon]|nr:hypothetical protein [Thermoplasmata archaeon]
MRNRRRGTVALLLTVGAGLVLTLALIPSGPIAPNRAPGAPSSPLATDSSCGGAPVPPILTGTLTDEGTVLPQPVVANATVHGTVEFETTDTSKYGTTVTCGPTTAQGTVNASGGFVLNLTLPSGSCGPTGCLSYSGPYTPTSYRVVGGSAPAYFLRSARNGSQVTLDWVAALDSATTSPNEFGTVSVDAPTTLLANAWDGAGDPSTANVTYAWQLAGTAWGSTGPVDGSTFLVNGTVAGQPGTVTLWVNGSFNGTAIALPPVHLYLAAAETAAQDGSVYPSALDVGVPAVLTLNATGSGGYVYAASLSPGLGGTERNVTCRTVAASGGTVDVSCAFSVTYEEAGEVAPEATVTNGYSAASYTYLPVVVSAAFAVSVGPDPAEAYVGGPLHVQVSVVPHTGTGPFGPACLLTGDGRFLCDRSPGSSWTLPVTYSNPGTYSGVVTVADSSLVNRTVGIGITISTLPTTPSVSLDRSTVELGDSVTASATIAGGAFPLTYWWNASALHGTVDTGVTFSDAIPSATFTPGTVGAQEVTLTVVDALGTVVASDAPLTVEGDVVGLVAVAPQTNESVPAGTAVAVAIHGVDSLRNFVPAFAANVTIRVASGCGTVWLNDSSGAVPWGENSSAALGAANWTDGAAELTVAASSAGPCAIVVASPLLAGPAEIRFQVSANSSDLRLIDPDYVRAGPTDNSTEYAIVDEFGNPDRSGYVIVETAIGAVRTTVDSPIHDGSAGPTVWVNFSATQPGSGVLTVLSETNRSLLMVRISGPAGTTGLSALDEVALVGVALGAVLVAGVVVDRRRRAAAPAARAPPEDPDEPLRRLAEGRSHVLSRLAADHDTDLDGVADGFPGPPPDAAELAEWIGTLVTEGIVRPSVGPDGRPRFRLANPDDRPAGPRVEVDPLALDAALARRDFDAADADDERPPA